MSGPALVPAATCSRATRLPLRPKPHLKSVGCHPSPLLRAVEVVASELLLRGDDPKPVGRFWQRFV